MSDAALQLELFGHMSVPIMTSWWLSLAGRSRVNICPTGVFRLVGSYILIDSCILFALSFPRNLLTPEISTINAIFLHTHTSPRISAAFAAAARAMVVCSLAYFLADHSLLRHSVLGELASITLH